MLYNGHQKISGWEKPFPCKFVRHHVFPCCDGITMAATHAVWTALPLSCKVIFFVVCLFARDSLSCSLERYFCGTCRKATSLSINQSVCVLSCPLSLSNKTSPICVAFSPVHFHNSSSNNNNNNNNVSKQTHLDKSSPDVANIRRDNSGWDGDCLVERNDGSNKSHVPDAEETRKEDTACRE